MKIAVIGTGKTGGKVPGLLEEEQIVGPFNTGNPPTVKKLQPADAAIIFVPGSAVQTILDTVMEAGLNAAWGSTGYEWDDKTIDKRLKAKNIKWMRASNFSLGMQIVRRCLTVIGEGIEALDNPAIGIHEIHHTGKKDAPSGTALSWQQWLGKEVDITYERKGDIKGIHELSVETKTESISLKHQAHDRALFAKGALWAVRQLQQRSLKPGFYTMQTLFDEKMS